MQEVVFQSKEIGLWLIALLIAACHVTVGFGSRPSAKT